MTSSATQPDRSRLAQLRPVSLQSRRRVVVAFGAAIVLTAVAGSLPDAPFLTLLGILLALGLGGVLRWSVHSTADLPDEQLDERLIRERDAAYLISYQVIAAVVVVLAVGLDIAVPLLERSTNAEVSDITRLTGAFLPSIPPLALFAPSAVLAWRRTEV